MTVRAVLAKVGLDGHDVGIRVIAKQLSTAGVEVIYLGKRNTPEGIARTAVDEDADVVGVSCLSGSLAEFGIEVVDLLEQADAPIPVVAGGIDESEQVQRMLDHGVRAFFGPGTPVSEVVQMMTAVASART